uniref:Uncharacterized protein n=1 Tax=Arion vulgaris TaxID=1028688 RepID=A0A0B7A8V2_9EUPU
MHSGSMITFASAILFVALVIPITAFPRVKRQSQYNALPSLEDEERRIEEVESFLLQYLDQNIDQNGQTPEQYQALELLWNLLVRFLTLNNENGRREAVDDYHSNSIDSVLDNPNVDRRTAGKTVPIKEKNWTIVPLNHEKEKLYTIATRSGFLKLTSDKSYDTGATNSPRFKLSTGIAGFFKVE